jgi:UDPglucose 6-dehydrogenase
MKLLIVGHGFVGRAVDYGFATPLVDKTIVDPKYGTSLAALDIADFDTIFVCVPTPMGIHGGFDVAILSSVMERLIESKNPDQIIVVKSTIPPDIIEKYTDPRVVYNPEFLTEKSANEQFINPQFHVMGGDPDVCARLEDIFKTYSNILPTTTHVMTKQEASFVKYSINSFLALKVTFFNQLFDTVQEAGANYSIIANAVGSDCRIGHSHTRVPGFDHKQGFGGACFPKDTSAFVKYSDRLTLIEECIKINNRYRSPYELDAREKEQNIEYNGQTKEEQ